MTSALLDSASLSWAASLTAAASPPSPPVAIASVTTSAAAAAASAVALGPEPPGSCVGVATVGVRCRRPGRAALNWPVRLPWLLWPVLRHARWNTPTKLSASWWMLLMIRSRGAR